MTARISVIVPVHDEAATVAANLTRMLAGDVEDAIELVVVANGCSDTSADLARAVASRIRVVEITEASKIAALNAGDAATSVFPRMYVDADVRIDAHTILAVADALSTDDVARVAAPQLVVDAARSSWPARQYFRVWELSDYRRSAHVGSGVYALSAAGRERFGDFPRVIADDRYVQLLFAPEERTAVEGTSFTVPAPRTLRAQVRRGARILAGNAQLATQGQTSGVTSGGVLALLSRAARRPSLWAGAAIYSYAYLASRRIAHRMVRTDSVTWNRDHTTRVAVAE